jgi:coatomer subunit beta'
MLFYYQGLVLLASASGNARMMHKIADASREKGQNNISFLSYFTLGKLEDCLELLIDTNRLPEAAFFARTYLPSQVSRVVGLWREELRKKNEKAAQALADPKDYENLFNGYQATLRAEQFLAHERNQSLPASGYPNIQVIDMIFSTFSVFMRKIIN